jgi:hypothetical protein
MASAPLPLALAGLACGSATGIDGVGDGAGGFAGSDPGSGGGGGGGSITKPCMASGCGSVCKPWNYSFGPPGGTITMAQCQSICGQLPLTPCTFGLGATGEILVACQYGCLTGRRPAGLVDTSRAERETLGDYFAEIAFLEAASVDAFRVLARELRHHKAPDSLVRAARRAASDEVRHARMATTLARRAGVTPRAPRIEPRSVRTLEAIAIENAAEGCVRETFGALLATHQARAATSADLRRTFARIAKDETRHAALAWRVARWLDGRLDRGARLRVRAARRVAAERLVRAARAESRQPWSDSVGLPGSRLAVKMADGMHAALWCRGPTKPPRSGRGAV